MSNAIMRIQKFTDATIVAESTALDDTKRDINLERATIATMICHDACTNAKKVVAKHVSAKIATITDCDLLMTADASYVYI